MTDVPEPRLARPADVPALQRLIERSVRGLSVGFYDERQVESALLHLFGPDTQLIADGTYYVIDAGGTVVAGGGWSRRRTLYGGDQTKGAEDPELDPRTEPARIRAMYVDPAYARRGLGRRLFERCAAEAAAAGFTMLELMATLPGVPLYRALGFEVVAPVTVTLPDGIRLDGFRMRRPARILEP